MRVRGEEPGGETPIGEAASLMSRRAGNARAGFCDPIPNPGRAERLRSVWKGAGDRCPGWQMDLPGETRRTAAPLKAMRTGTCVHAWRSARVVSDLQDVKNGGTGVRGYGGTGVRGYGGTGVRGYGGTGVRGYGMMYRLCHCQPATALTVVMALHRHPFNPRTRYRCTLA